MATFLQDTFTEAAGVTLASHSADTGGSGWTKAAFDADTASVDADLDRVKGDAGSSAYYFHSVTPGGEEYDITIVGRTSASTSFSFGILARLADHASTPSYYSVMLEDDGTLRLTKNVSGGGETSLGSFALGPVVNQDYTIKFEVRNSTKKVYVDTVERISSADDAITAAGKVGIRITSAGEITSLLAEDAAGDSQLLAPIQDISTGTWLPSSGSPAELWQMIDGEKSPDTDYDYTTSAGTMEVKFASGSTPSLQTGHTLRYRLRGNGTCDAVVKLKVGTTVVSQWTETNVPAVDTDYSHTLDSSPSFTISDYTDLRISVEAVP
jgi:hypothetical protein